MRFTGLFAAVLSILILHGYSPRAEEPNYREAAQARARGRENSADRDRSRGAGRRVFGGLRRQPISRIYDSQVQPAFYPTPDKDSGEEIKEIATPKIPNLVAEEGEHPLAPAIRWARERYPEVCKIEDYSCTLVKRERIDDELRDHEYMFVKVRHEPFSVYTCFKGPTKLAGQEAIYVDGANDNLIVAHPNGMRQKLIGTVRLKPTGKFAMEGNRYPITEMGIRRLCERLIEVGEHDMQFGECEVKIMQKAMINKRACTCIDVTHPVPREDFEFHRARIFVDNDMNMPIRYEAYLWPEAEGEDAPLIEEYTFLNLKINNGYTDQDFNTENPEYGY